MTRSHPLTTFIGRESALRQVRDLLGSARLVTITGTGGLGKTRLALELLDRTARAFPDGVAVVELAALGDGAEVPSATAAALAVPDQSTRPVPEQIARHLAGRKTLLLVDNCEHVLEAASELIAYLLEEVDGLTVVTTSREPLDLAGEQIFPLGPLGLPTGGRDDRAAVDSAEAVRLLIERARAFLPNFAVADHNRAAVVKLCERLDGMPLAIELAAARLRTLSVEQVLDRLDARFTLLNKGSRAELPRHRTLWDLVDWSLGLCTADERRLWARLSVFPGTFDLDAAETVCAYGDLEPVDVLDLLDRLGGQVHRHRGVEWADHALSHAGHDARVRRRPARRARRARRRCSPPSGLLPGPRGRHGARLVRATSARGVGRHAQRSRQPSGRAGMVHEYPGGGRPRCRARFVAALPLDRWRLPQ